MANCDPGTTNSDHQQAVIARINYFRALTDLPPVTLLAAAQTTQVQAAALMMSANNALSHQPPPTWLCYSANGAAGASNANIALGAQGVDAVDLYVDDPGDNNAAAGHRRWILFPPRSAMATGDIVGGNTPPRPANAVYVFGPSTTRPATPNGIAWPPAGLVPYQNLPRQSNRWSLSYPGADFSRATVAMTGPNGTISASLEQPANGFGDNTIVFLPVGVGYAKPATDTTYTIVVNGIAGAGVPSTLQYAVTVIDPDVTPPPPACAGGQFWNGAACVCPVDRVWNGTECVLAASFEGLWWNSPAGSESGWGINLEHQGDIIFSTWFTYDVTGQPWWLSMTAVKTANATFTGTLYQTRGPAFDAVPFNPTAVAPTAVGSGTLAFSDSGNGTFSYTVNGVSQTKSITRQVFGPQPTCSFGVQTNLALATNYQGLWWNDPAASEAGWGINLAHQGDVIFATWFTYAFDGSPLWLSVTATKTGAATYSGDLYQTRGPAFSAAAFNSAAVTRAAVGTASFTFGNGNSARFAYAIGGVAQSKSIVRQVFVSPGTVCN